MGGFKRERAKTGAEYKASLVKDCGYVFFLTASSGFPLTGCERQRRLETARNEWNMEEEKHLEG